MTKKVMALALVGTVAYCAPASANVLPLKTARQAAKRLAAKQVRTRHVVSTQVGAAHRVSDREITFAYADRSAQNVFCTSVIVVKLRTPTTRTARASFRKSRCSHVPDDALAYEAATRNAVHAVGAEAGAVKASLAALRRSSAPCRRLRVPASRRREVALFTVAANTRAMFGPVSAELRDFANAIGSVRTGDRVLVAGAAGWADLLEVYQGLPDFQPSLCAALKTWARGHWALSAAPADYAALKGMDARARRDQLAIARASAHMANVGVFPRTAVAFTPPGMIALGAGIR